jgi:hypothetical protein
MVWTSVLYSWTISAMDWSVFTSLVISCIAIADGLLSRWRIASWASLMVYAVLTVVWKSRLNLSPLTPLRREFPRSRTSGLEGGVDVLDMTGGVVDGVEAGG